MVRITQHPSQKAHKQVSCLDTSALWNALQNGSAELWVAEGWLPRLRSCRKTKDVHRHVIGRRSRLSCRPGNSPQLNGPRLWETAASHTSIASRTMTPEQACSRHDGYTALEAHRARTE